MPSTPRVTSREAETFAAGQVIPVVFTANRGAPGPNPPSGNAAAVAPAGQRPRAGTVASCAHETTPAGTGLGGPNGLGRPKPGNVPGMVSPGAARTTTTPWTPAMPRNVPATGPTAP